jgi:hypothetical protein
MHSHANFLLFTHKHTNFAQSIHSSSTFFHLFDHLTLFCLGAKRMNFNEVVPSAHFSHLVFSFVCRFKLFTSQWLSMNEKLFLFICCKILFDARKSNHFDVFYTFSFLMKESCKCSITKARKFRKFILIKKFFAGDDDVMFCYSFA